MTSTITFDDDDGYTREVEVDYDIYPASRGYRNSMGVPEEPDEDESLEIDSIREAEEEIEVSDAEMARIEKAIWDSLDDD